jgi:hypothetical protein
MQDGGHDRSKYFKKKLEILLSVTTVPLVYKLCRSISVMFFYQILIFCGDRKSKMTITA